MGGAVAGLPNTFLCHASASASFLPLSAVPHTLAVVFAKEQASIRQYVSRENNQINAAHAEHLHGMMEGKEESDCACSLHSSR